MMTSVAVAADLTVSLGEDTVRIRGENSDLVADADSWRPVLGMRAAHGLADSLRTTFPLGKGRLRVNVRSIPVLTIRLDGHRLSRRVHPLGVIRSFLRR